jgi:hypothetical protein
MDELLALLERYSPGYRGRVEGAGFWQLDVMEERFGRPLPGFYRRFAEVMGAQAGPLLAGLHAYHPNDIAELYAVAPPGELPPDRFLYVFGDPSQEGDHYFLDLDAPEGADDAEVVRFPFGADAWKTRLVRRFASLREMLLVFAVRHVALPTFPHRAQLASGAAREAPGAGEAADLFLRLGFAALPYPRSCLLFERRDAVIELDRAPGQLGFSCRVGMRDALELRRFTAIVEERLQLVHE